MVPAHHHVGVQTADLENCLAWYRDFLGAEQTWSLDRFSELTSRRLPGIRRLVEVRVGGTRFHLFERAGRGTEPAHPDTAQFQHLCMSVDSPRALREMRRHWNELYDSGRHTFAFSERPTEIVTDDQGVQSFYAYDVNGLEFEFTFIPDGIDDDQNRD
ncbi:Catechol 2,3-dioxygenase [Thermomonospora echinospora]|uniref:Catechol 2,3-dioxygenase n=1 Tax=Thermomonospora echinospora TaxID=1992 RepID=A0A1H6DDX3_9ACTN|nr:VOC family protein [Thermomonospora echinospora]SEG83568.1 Catechol 2,3-dioxygenase [Thermomonospora echinospora]